MTRLGKCSVCRKEAKSSNGGDFYYEDRDAGSVNRVVFCSEKCYLKLKGETK